MPVFKFCVVWEDRAHSHTADEEWISEVKVDTESLF